MTAGVRIVGCGNPDRGDDAAGLLLARRMRELGVESSEECQDTFSLLDSLRNAVDVTLVDAAVSGAPPGTIKRWDVDTNPTQPLTGEIHNITSLDMDAGTSTEELDCTFGHYRTSTHGFDIAQAIELARTLNQLPRRLRVYGIEGSQFEICTQPSTEVLAAVESLARHLAAADSRVQS